MITFDKVQYLACIFLSTCLAIFPGRMFAQQDLDKADSLKQAGNYEEALKIFESNLKEAIETKNREDESRGYNNIANVYSDKGEYEKSTEYYFKALKLAAAAGDLHVQAVINYNIASNYFNIGKPEYIKQYINNAIQLIKDNPSEEKLLGNCYNMLGGLATEEKKYQEAVDYLKKAESIFLKVNEPDWLANVYMQFSLLFHELKDHKSAMEYSRKGLSIFKVQNDPIGIAISYQNLLRAHFYFWNPSGKMTNKKETLKAIEFADSVYSAVKGIEAPEILITLYKNKQEFYAWLNQYDSAHVYLTKYVLLKDSIHGIEKNRQLEELKIQYDVEKKERENEQLNAKNERRTLFAIIGFSAACCLVLIFIIFVLRSSHKKKQKEIEFEKSKLEFEHQALRAQMNPHFIFNAINSIQKNILKENKQQAYDYLTKFAKLIRMVLNNSQEKSLTLQQELDMIDLYVELEQLRFDDKFDFEIKMDENLNEFDTSVPAMLIQPYIENAIWHGLMNLEGKRRGKLSLSISRDKDLLRIIIEDNGIGREKAKEYKKADSHRSIGMLLTEQRLLMISKMQEYENARVLITDLYDKKEPVGTKVEITLPFDGK